MKSPMDKLELALWSLENSVRDTALAIRDLGGPANLSPLQLADATRALETTVRVLVPVIDSMRATVLGKLEGLK